MVEEDPRHFQLLVPLLVVGVPLLSGWLLFDYARL